MSAHTVAEAFADAAARLTDGGSDTAGDLVALLIDCTALMRVESAGVLIEVPGEGLALVSTTSHTAEVLELYELQNGDGPCIHSIRHDTTVTAVGPELERDWGPVGAAMLAAGYHGLYAFPLRWHDQAIGALNLFVTHRDPLDDDERRLGQAFANMAAAILTTIHPTRWSDIAADIDTLLTGRIAIEQAKGILAVQHGLSLADAYALLLRTAEESRVPLTEHVRRVVASTTRG